MIDIEAEIEQRIRQKLATEIEDRISAWDEHDPCRHGAEVALAIVREHGGDQA